MAQSDIYESEEFRGELKKCKIFHLKYPRGGHNNDGYELLGKLVFADGKALLVGLDSIGAEYSLHKEKPECWTPPPLLVEGHLNWIEYKYFCDCLGYKTHIRVGTSPSDFFIEFNLNSTSWYDVVIEDVERAISLEKALVAHGIV